MPLRAAPHHQAIHDALNRGQIEMAHGAIQRRGMRIDADEGWHRPVQRSNLLKVGVHSTSLPRPSCWEAVRRTRRQFIARPLNCLGAALISEW